MKSAKRMTSKEVQVLFFTYLIGLAIATGISLFLKFICGYFGVLENVSQLSWFFFVCLLAFLVRNNKRPWEYFADFAIALTFFAVLVFSSIPYEQVGQAIVSLQGEKAPFLTEALPVLDPFSSILGYIYQRADRLSALIFLIGVGVQIAHFTEAIPVNSTSRRNIKNAYIIFSLIDIIVSLTEYPIFRNSLTGERITVSSIDAVKAVYASFGQIEVIPMGFVLVFASVFSLDIAIKLVFGKPDISVQPQRTDYGSASQARRTGPDAAYHSRRTGSDAASRTRNAN